MNRKVVLFVMSILATIFIVSATVPMTIASLPHQGEAPDDLVITSVLMEDYNLICKVLGGQYVDIAVWVKNVGDTTITEDFDVWFWVNEVSQEPTVHEGRDIDPGEKIKVINPNVHFYYTIDDYTLDAYINDDEDTHKYCNFVVTLLGLS